MTRPSVTRRQLTFALSVFLALPLAAVSPFVTRTLLAGTEAGKFIANGGHIATWKLAVHGWTVFGAALVMFVVGVVACHTFAGLLHDRSYRPGATANESA